MGGLGVAGGERAQRPSYWRVLTLRAARGKRAGGCGFKGGLKALVQALAVVPLLGEEQQCAPLRREVVDHEPVRAPEGVDRSLVPSVAVAGDTKARKWSVLC